MIAAPGVPVIDLSLPPGAESVTGAIDRAAVEFGFFQIVNHGIDSELIDRVWERTRAFFDLPIATKRAIARTKANSRGYYDRELTKNARDLKEVLDLAHVPHPDLADDDPRNHHRVDGINRWPDLPGFRATLIEYLAACEGLSYRLLSEFSVAMGEAPGRLDDHFRQGHTSFVRLNHYPTADLLTEAEAAADEVVPLGDMALHHHSDAGALTLLLQDDVGGLQVHVPVAEGSARPGGAAGNEVGSSDGGRWVDVEPLPGAVVVNTGDMMQVWSNDRYRAALHRVAPMSGRRRFSLPYFFNPSYDTDYAPLAGSVGAGQGPHYRTINWGQFRQARADGDYADHGHEIQIADFRT